MYGSVVASSVYSERIDVFVLEAAEDGAAVEDGEDGGGHEGQQDGGQDVVVHKHLKFNHMYVQEIFSFVYSDSIYKNGQISFK